MKSVSVIFGLSTLGIIAVSLVASYFIADTKQNTIVQSMNETIRSSIMQNVDNSSRIYENELFISISDFESDFLDTITSYDVKELVDGDYTFEYLKNPNGSIKAVRVKMKDSKGKNYQASSAVDISES